MKIKFLSKTADRIFKKHGYDKTYESDTNIRYEKYISVYGYIACIEISHRKNIPTIVSCYDKTNIKAPEYYSPSVGMTGVLMWASFLKMIGMDFLPDLNYKNKLKG